MNDLVTIPAWLNFIFLVCVGYTIGNILFVITSRWKARND